MNTGMPIFSSFQNIYGRAFVNYQQRNIYGFLNPSLTQYLEKKRLKF